MASAVIVHTTIVSMKISLDATGTLEIPPELIFTTTQTPKGPSPTHAQSGDTQDATATSAALPADSSTVPPLAVDALLSQTPLERASEQASEEEVLQLDLLGGPPADAKVVG